MIPSNVRGCQPSTWSLRSTKVNGTLHGDSPLLKPKGIKNMLQAPCPVESPENIVNLSASRRCLSYEQQCGLSGSLPLFQKTTYAYKVRTETL